MRYLTLVVIGFVVLCGWMVIESGVFQIPGANSGAFILLQSTPGNENSPSANAPSEEPPRMTADNSVTYGADSAAASSLILASCISVSLKESALSIRVSTLEYGDSCS